ncbi:Common central domain of tyrosinase [Chromobacterium violaceum]|uniref:Common central domain of tyrosinase n=1 Tax=Chromobacterium violaceum TaxID=536 RepID=A0A447THB9_CHRVL|nr:Common central domain of tyrosinase [Chromobacterium violaceum]
MPTLRMRKNVSTLDAGDQTLLWYARAVHDMQQRPSSDATSWQYQAAVHGTRQNPAAFTPDQRQAWAQCQHATWFFLPWHRAYLGIFEDIVANTVARLGGPQDWALPYWNYSDPGARALPSAFAAKQFAGLPGQNPLLVERDQGNDGKPFLDNKAVSLNCLKRKGFAGHLAPGGDSGFADRCADPTTWETAIRGNWKWCPTT